MLVFRPADPADAVLLADLVRRAYRGEVGWTTEAAMLNDERVNTAAILKKLQDAETRVLVAEEGGRVVGCCEIVQVANGGAYFGMFAVEPTLQAAGLGRQILAHAELTAAERWGSLSMEMTVIAQRDELIAWYQRRGYTKLEETRPFPFNQLINGVALRDDLHFVVLKKTLQSSDNR